MTCNLGPLYMKINLCCRKGKGTLRFELGGKDLTKADKRLTDAEIGRQFPLGLLERAVFYGQTEVSALLEVRAF